MLKYAVSIDLLPVCKLVMVERVQGGVGGDGPGAGLATVQRLRS